jgi:hypothetical protein
MEIPEAPLKEFPNRRDRELPPRRHRRTMLGQSSRFQPVAQLDHRRRMSYLSHAPRSSKRRQKSENLGSGKGRKDRHSPCRIGKARASDRLLRRAGQLDILERVMRRFYLRGLVEESMGIETDWKAADSAFVQAAAIARDVAKYKHAALSAVRLAGDITAMVADDATLDELLEKIRDELRKLGPLIDLESIREPQGSRTEGGLTVRELNHRGGPLS